MKRRQLLLALGASALASPRASFAQQPPKVRRIRFLAPADSGEKPGEPSPYAMAFVREMQAAGHIFGSDSVIEVRSAQGDYGAHDPVGMKMAASLARPGGNLIGLASFYGELIPKHLEWVRSLLPEASRVAILSNAGSASDPSAAVERRGEAFVVVLGLPVSESGSGRLEVREAVAAPEPHLIDPMAPLDCAVLLRSRGPNVSVPDPGGLDPRHEGKGELLPEVALQSLDGERKGPPELGEERETRAMIQTSVKPERAEARAVVQGGGLKRPLNRPHG